MMDYKEQLNDVRWKVKRARTIYFADNECQLCGYHNFLQVHHKEYINGLMAWEYDIKYLIVLCGKCHYTIHRPELEYIALDKLRILNIYNNHYN